MTMTDTLKKLKDANVAKFKDMGEATFTPIYNAAQISCEVSAKGDVCAPDAVDAMFVSAYIDVASDTPADTTFKALVAGQLAPGVELDATGGNKKTVEAEPEPAPAPEPTSPSTVSPVTFGFSILPEFAGFIAMEDANAPTADDSRGSFYRGPLTLAGGGAKLELFLRFRKELSAVDLFADLIGSIGFNGWQGTRNLYDANPENGGVMAMPWGGGVLLGLIGKHGYVGIKGTAESMAVMDGESGTDSNLWIENRRFWDNNRFAVALETALLLSKPDSKSSPWACSLVLGGGARWTNIESNYEFPIIQDPGNGEEDLTYDEAAQKAADGTLTGTLLGAGRVNYTNVFGISPFGYLGLKWNY